MGIERGRAAAGGGIYEVTNIALDVWVTDEQEGLISERVLPNLLVIGNPDAQSSIRATPANQRVGFWSALCLSTLLYNFCTSR